jgi:hypothetical protein
LFSKKMQRCGFSSTKTLFTISPFSLANQRQIKAVIFRA